MVQLPYTSPMTPFSNSRVAKKQVLGPVGHLRLYGPADAVDPFDVADVVAQQIEMVDGVDHQDAAAVLGIAHPSFPRTATAAHDRVGPYRLHLADVSLVDETLHRGGLRRIAQVLRHHQCHAGRVGGFDHVPATVKRGCHRLLDEHVLAGLGGGDGLGRMQVVTGADIDRIDVAVSQHFFVVEEDRIDARLLRVLLRTGLDDVAHGREVYALGMREVRVHVPIGNAPGANEADFHGLRHVSPSHLRSERITDWLKSDAHR